MKITSTSGFTIFELLVVLVLIGAVATVALPRVGKTFEGAGVRSAKQEIAAAMASARASAVQNGAPTTFQRSGNSIRVTMQLPSGASQTIMPYTDLHAKHGVVLGGLETFSYNTRGFASGLSAQMGVIRMQRGASSDSLCVMGVGKVLTTGCSL